MAVSRISIFIVEIALCALLTGGVVAWDRGLTSGRIEAQQPQKKKEPTERDKAFVKAAKDLYESAWGEYQNGGRAIDWLFPWSVNWLKADLRLSNMKADKVAAHERHLERIDKVLKITKSRWELGAVGRTPYFQAVYCRHEAEIWLDEAKAKD
jgi:hypothetical protein